jgi:hypothetical protein
MKFIPVGSPALQLVASTPETGFALQDATPAIVTWTAPNDGQQHYVMCMASEQVTSALTGGSVIGLITPPGGGSPAQPQALAAGQAAGNHVGNFACVVGPGTTVTIEQGSAVTGGAATVWIGLWGY